MSRAFIDFQSIKRAVSVPRALAALGWRCTRAEPAGLRGPCPVHGSRSQGSRSLSVTAQTWYCHVCRRGGDVVRLWGVLHQMDDYEAAIALCRALDVRLPLRGAPVRRPPEQ